MVIMGSEVCGHQGKEWGGEGVDTEKGMFKGK